MNEPFPTLYNNHYIIRKFEMTDLSLIEEAAKDDLIPYITTVPTEYNEAKGKEYIERQWLRFDNNEGYSFVIAQKKSNHPVGSIFIGLQNLKEGRASIGYWVITAHRGNNIGKVCLKTITEWAFTTLKTPRLELYIEPWNKSSLKTAKSIGFEEEGIMRSWQEVKGERKDMIMLSLINKTKKS